jgi:hypothetical protein
MINFQEDVERWVLDCFGKDSFQNTRVRALRFLEESIELCQSVGITNVDCLKLIGQVYEKPEGEIVQEIGGTMTTLAPLCSNLGIDMLYAGRKELEILIESEKSRKLSCINYERKN